MSTKQKELCMVLLFWIHLKVLLATIHLNSWVSCISYHLSVLPENDGKQ